DPRDGPEEPLQARDAAHREAQPPHRRPRLPLSQRLGVRLTETEADAGSTESTAGPTDTLSAPRFPQAQAPGGPSASRGPSVGPASLRLGLGYGLALGGATCFGVGGVIAKTAFNAGVEPA